MAFIGAAVVEVITDGLVRITGLSLNNQASPSGTIGLHERLIAPGVRLPASFKPRKFSRPDEATDVSLQDAVQCWFVYTNGGATLQPINIVKTGTTPEDFLITLTDSALAAGDPPAAPTSTGNLEIYVRFH